jgi:hypothetical protein
MSEDDPDADSEDDGGEAAGETPHERMETFADLAAKERESRRRKERVLADIGDDLGDAVATAAERGGINVEVTETSRDGTHQTLRARLDRAALVAAVSDQLPPGFVVEHVNDDGTLTVQWDERATVPDRRHHGALLKAIVAEETELDEDGLIVSVPTRERVVQRAVALGTPEEKAASRLDHLAQLDVVDIDDGRVYPDSNFSKG